MNTFVGVQWVSEEKQLDRGIIAGIVLCIFVIGAGVLVGGNPLNFVSFPSLIIVLGGTIAASLVHFSLYDLEQARQAMRSVLLTRQNHAHERIQDIVRMAHAVRHHGLLKLEAESRTAQDPFLRKALELVVDGQSGDEIKHILETEIRVINDRSARAVQVFNTMGSYAPALGLIGTLIGLIQMLGSLENPATVGPAMSVALITTFYGAILANLFFLPIAGKIRNRAEEDSLVKALTIEGALGLGRQENAIVIEQRLQSFLPL